MGISSLFRSNQTEERGAVHDVREHHVQQHDEQQRLGDGADRGARHGVDRVPAGMQADTVSLQARGWGGLDQGWSRRIEATLTGLACSGM